MRWTFWVPGTPVPQGSMRAFTRKNGDAYIVHSNKGLGAWRKAIVDTVGGKFKELNEAVAVQCTFHLQRPRTVTRPLPWCRPDIDKLMRAVLDALQTAGAFKDDGQVVSIKADKLYVEQGPGAAITISPGINVLLKEY